MQLTQPVIVSSFVKIEVEREPFEKTDYMLGQGRHGPVKLIVQGGENRALKTVKKHTLTSTKMIQHVK